MFSRVIDSHNSLYLLGLFICFWNPSVVISSWLTVTKILCYTCQHGTHIFVVCCYIVNFFSWVWTYMPKLLFSQWHRKIFARKSLAAVRKSRRYIWIHNTLTEINLSNGSIFIHLNQPYSNSHGGRSISQTCRPKHSGKLFRRIHFCVGHITQRKALPL